MVISTLSGFIRNCKYSYLNHNPSCLVAKYHDPLSAVNEIVAVSLPLRT